MFFDDRLNKCKELSMDLRKHNSFLYEKPPTGLSRVPRFPRGPEGRF